MAPFYISSKILRSEATCFLAKVCGFAIVLDIILTFSITICGKCWLLDIPQISLLSISQDYSNSVGFLEKQQSRERLGILVNLERFFRLAAVLYFSCISSSSFPMIWGGRRGGAGRGGDTCSLFLLILQLWKNSLKSKVKFLITNFVLLTLQLNCQIKQ